MRLIATRKLEIEQYQQYLSLKHALQLLFCVPNVVNLYDFVQMSIVKHFSVESIKFEFGNKEKVKF